MPEARGVRPRAPGKPAGRRISGRGGRPRAGPRPHRSGRPLDGGDAPVVLGRRNRDPQPRRARSASSRFSPPALCVGLVILVVLGIAHAPLRRSISLRRIGLHVARNTIHFAGQYLWALGVTLLPLATVFALEFTMPAFTVLLAALALGERLTPSRLGVVVFGLIGTLVIVRPGLETLPPHGGSGHRRGLRLRRVADPAQAAHHDGNRLCDRVFHEPDPASARARRQRSAVPAAHRRRGARGGAGARLFRPLRALLHRQGVCAWAMRASSCRSTSCACR